ncbi:MAG: DUF362 domain-containing protein [Candidatus Lokiarchaeota archaeon]|nr:DUF362 domain-containing protein [Candidatus Lokiarchaeota archaeon]
MAKIYYSRSRDRKKFVESVLEIFKDEIKGRVFIKPNIVSHEPYPTTTNLELLEEVLKQFNGKKIAIGDASAVDLPNFNVKQSKINEICESYGMKLINLYENMKKIETNSGFEFKVAQVPLTYESIISLPILKTHIACDITGALKNCFGYLSKGERLKLHSSSKNIDINRAIAELNTIYKPTLTIMDGIKTLITANEVRHGGRERGLGILIAGTDPVALDAYGLTILKKIDPKLSGKTLEDIAQIKYALDLGLGSIEYELIEIDEGIIHNLS